MWVRVWVQVWLRVRVCVCRLCERPAARHTTRRGTKQGDALAPALDALGQHDAFVAADEQARVGIGVAQHGGVNHPAAETFRDCEPSENFARSGHDRSDHTVQGLDSGAAGFRCQHLSRPFTQLRGVRMLMWQAFAVVLVF